MRGGDARTEALFSYVSCEARVPLDHPLRAIGKIVNEALTALSPELEKLYAKSGRPSIPPEKLLRALLLQAFYSVRSERQLMEQLDYNLLFRWFVGLSQDAAVWDVTVFTKGLSGNKRAIWGISLRRDSVVPLAVEFGAFDIDRGHLGVRDDNAAGVLASVEFAAHSEAGFGGGGRD